MREKIQSLMERAEKALVSAELLLNSEDFDTSVSRSYYAMFYAAEAVLLTKELKFSSHRSVISLFGEHFVKTNIFPPEMGKKISRSFDKRLVGDYSFTPRTDEETAKETLGWAKELVEEIEKYLEGWV